MLKPEKDEWVEEEDSMDAVPDEDKFAVELDVEDEEETPLPADDEAELELCVTWVPPFPELSVLEAEGTTSRFNPGLFEFWTINCCNEKKDLSPVPGPRNSRRNLCFPDESFGVCIRS